MMFLKRQSDAFDQEQEKVIAQYEKKGKSAKLVMELAQDVDEYNKTFFILEISRWENLKDLKNDIGASMNKATEAIEEHNHSLGVCWFLSILI